MAEVFLDTSFAIAVTVPADQHHEVAVQLARNLRGARTTLVTTHAILGEIGDAFGKVSHRPSAVRLLHALQTDASILVLPIDADLFLQGSQFFAERTDKDWGLTDCISFVLMSNRGIRDALTADRHFEQAGFRALLRDRAA